MRERAIVCGSASKAYAMTGWRCGWTVGPKEVIAACGALQSHQTSNVCSITQKAVVAALTGPQDCVTAMLDEYRSRRDQVWTWLTADPRIKCVKPAGAFYLFIDISELLSPTGISTSAEFADRLIEESYVVTTAGEAFDAPGFLRISYANSLERLKEACDRLSAFVKTLRSGRGRSLSAGAVTPEAGAVAARRGRGLRRRAPPPIVGADFVRDDDASRLTLRHRRAEARPRRRLVVIPGTTAEVAAIAALCDERRRPARAARRRHGLHRRRRARARRRRRSRSSASTASSRSTPRNLLAVVQPGVITGDAAGRGRSASACSIRPIRPACASRASAATSPNAPAGRARSSTARPSATSSASRRCCRRARSSAPAARR